MPCTAVLLFKWLRECWWKNGVKDPVYSMTIIPVSLLKALQRREALALARGNGTKDNISNVDMIEVSYDQIAAAHRQQGGHESRQRAVGCHG